MFATIAGMRAVVATLLGAAGCAQIAGIDTTTGPGPATVQLDRATIGAAVVQGPADLTATTTTATFLVPDPADPTGFDHVAPTLDAADAIWAAPIPDGTPTMLVQLDGGVPTLYAVGRAVADVVIALGHPNGTAATDATQMIAANVTIPAFNGTDTFRFVVAGAWVTRPFAGAELPAMSATTLAATFPYTSATPLVGGPLQAMTADDAALVLAYAGPTLVGALDVPGQPLAASVAIEGTLAPVAADHPVSVAIDPAGLAARVAPFAAPAIQWSITAAPGASIGSAFGIPLAAGTIAATDTAITGAYGNPFTTRAWPSTLLVTASTSRVYTPTAPALPATLTANVFELTPEGAFDAAFPAGLATAVTVDGTALADGASVTIAAGSPVDVSITADRADASAYALDVIELVPNDASAPTALIGNLKLHVVASGPDLQLPAATFENGHLYTLRASTFAGGYPAIAHGDLQTRMLPATLASVDSPVFTAVIP